MNLTNSGFKQGTRSKTSMKKITNALADDTFSAEAFADLKAQRDTAKTQRDAIKDQMDEARTAEIAAMTEAEKKPLNQEETDMKNAFVKDFKNLVRGRFQNALDSKTDRSGSDAGLTIPQDIQTAIHGLVRQYDSLQEYVTVENVTTATGSRVYEKWADITGLTELDSEGATIGANDDPKLTLIRFTIKRFAGISTVTNSLLADSAENILAWLSSWIAKKIVVTRNKKILEVIATLPTKPTLAK